MHAFVAFVILLAGCTTGSLRAGGVLTDGKPAFQASVEFGMSFGKRRLYELTHETGVEAGGDGASLVTAANADVVTLDEELGPIASLGVRMRGAVNQSPSFGARATFYTGMLRDPKTRSGGIGFELAGGAQPDTGAAVFEGSIVLTSKWSLL